MSGGLRARIEDPAGRARRRAAAQAFAAGWNGDEGVGPLRAALDRLPGGAGAAAIRAAALPWLADLRWIERTIARAVADMAIDPLFEAPFRLVSHEAQNGLRLFTHPAATLDLIHLPIDRVGARKRAMLGPRAILFSGKASLLRVVRAGGATLNLWRNDAARPCLSGADAGRCHGAGRIALADGMIRGFDGTCASWTIAQATGDIVLLQLIARAEMAPLMLEYDAVDGAFVAATTNDAAASRMQLIAALLRRMGRADAAPAIAARIGEAPFHLRWQLMRELLALDADRARPLLADLARGDDHPEVRAAARATIRLLAA